jgi:hypothetical protein
MVQLPAELLGDFSISISWALPAQGP